MSRTSYRFREGRHSSPLEPAVLPGAQRAVCTQCSPRGQVSPHSVTLGHMSPVGRGLGSSPGWPLSLHPWSSPSTAPPPLMLFPSCWGFLLCVHPQPLFPHDFSCPQRHSTTLRTSVPLSASRALWPQPSLCAYGLKSLELRDRSSSIPPYRQLLRPFPGRQWRGHFLHQQ